MTRQPSRIIDISLPISADLPVWPNSPEVSLTRRRDLGRGDKVNDTTLNFSVHTGTHIDAPAHFLGDGRTVDQLPLEQMNGPVYVADFTDRGVITEKDLEALELPDNVERILCKTANSERWTQDETEFNPDYVALSAGAAQWLVDHQFILVGVDYLSIKLYHDGPETHYILLVADMIVLEGVNLAGVDAGYYELICLPLRLEKTEGAPVRALLEAQD